MNDLSVTLDFKFDNLCIYSPMTFSKYAQKPTRLAIAANTKPIGPNIFYILEIINLILIPDSF